MSQLDRRHVLMALAAIAAAPATPAAALPQIDPDGARRIGRAYIAASKARLDAGRLQAELMTHGWNAAALKARAAADFRAGRLFIHRGWRISDTEGRLFALAALSPG
jgi:hypothetical protein